MKLITGAGLAGALLIAGGAPAVTLSQSAAEESPLGATSTVTTDADTTTAEGTEPGDVEAEATPDGTEDVESTEPESTDPEDTTDDAGGAVGPGVAHAALMKLWTDCVREAASGPKAEEQPTPPKEACWAKPLGPGQLKQLTGAADDDSTETDTAETEESATEADDAEAVEDSESSKGAGWGHHGNSRGHGAGHQGRGHGHGHHGG